MSKDFRGTIMSMSIPAVRNAVLSQGCTTKKKRKKCLTKIRLKLGVNKYENDKILSMK